MCPSEETRRQVLFLSLQKHSYRSWQMLYKNLPAHERFRYNSGWYGPSKSDGSLTVIGKAIKTALCARR